MRKSGEKNNVWLTRVEAAKEIIVRVTGMPELEARKLARTAVVK